MPKDGFTSLTVKDDEMHILEALRREMGEKSPRMALVRLMVIAQKHQEELANVRLNPEQYELVSTDPKGMSTYLDHFHGVISSDHRNPTETTSNISTMAA